MKKTYLIPALKVEEAQAAQMLAESLIIKKDTSGMGIDGGNAYTKEIFAWDIWGYNNDDE